MSSTIFGPTFVDLKYILNTSIDMISLFPTIFSVGNTFGTLCKTIDIFKRKFDFELQLYLWFSRSRLQICEPTDNTNLSPVINGRLEYYHSLHNRNLATFHLLLLVWSGSWSLDHLL